MYVADTKCLLADGFLASIDEPSSAAPSDEPKTPMKIPKKIPKRIIQNAAGIAVFTCMRSGLWMTGSGGSGILIARKSDGTWSPPSGIMLHTPTLSFIIGVDVYDCVLVVNSLSALESITQPRVTLGEDIGLKSGPLVPMDMPGTESEINLRELGNTVLTYMKARGQAQVVNLNGCILTERANENERFYESTSITQMDILAGNVSRQVEETQPLSEVIKLAEGRTDFDPAVIAKIAVEPAPGDARIASPESTPHSPRPFGIPQADDPDPFGVLALEMAGLEIREAGSRLRPASSQLDFHARPPSSALSKNYRQSGDTFLTKSNRESYMSSRTVKSQVTDACTQTDTGNTPETSPSPSRSVDSQEHMAFEKIPERTRRGEEQEDDDDVDYMTVDLTPLKHLSHPRASNEVVVADAATTTDTTTEPARDSTKLGPPTADEEMDRRSKASSHYGEDDDGEVSNDETDDDDDDDEEPIVFEVAAVQPTRTQAVASRMIQARGNMVTIPKRIPPPLPARNPARASMTSKSDQSGDAASFRSSLHQKPSNSDLGTDIDGQERLSMDIRSVEKLTVESRSPSPATEAKVEVPQVDERQPAETGSKGTEVPEIEDRQPAETTVKDAVATENQLEMKEGEEDKVEEAEPKAETKVQELQTEELCTKEAKTEERKTDKPRAEGTSLDEAKTEAKVDEPRIEETKTKTKTKVEEPTIEESGIEQSKIEELKSEEPRSDDLTREDSKNEKFEDAPATPTHGTSSSSDSHNKARLSIDTGATDARSSFEESSYTTPPTSERHFSADDDYDMDETPKKSSQDEQPVTGEKRDVSGPVDAPATNGVTAA